MNITPISTLQTRHTLTLLHVFESHQRAGAQVFDALDIVAHAKKVHNIDLDIRDAIAVIDNYRYFANIVDADSEDLALCSVNYLKRNTLQEFDTFN